MCRVVAPGGRYFDWLRTDPATISCGTNISEIFEGAKNSIINLVIGGLATHYFELMWVFPLSPQWFGRLNFGFSTGNHEIKQIMISAGMQLRAFSPLIRAIDFLP